MKARIKKTGEIVEVFKNKNYVYIDEEHRGHSAESLDFMFDEEYDHWQDVRERAAIAAMQTLIAELYDAKSNYLFSRNIAVCSVEYADELVKQLKKK